MENLLYFLSICALGYTQLIYPDQYERMKPSTIPAFVYSTARTERQMYANASNLVPLGSSNVQYNPQFSVSSAAAVPPPPAAVPTGNTYSTTPVASGTASTPDWNEHVNNIIARGVTKFTLDIEREVYRKRSMSVAGLRDNIVFSPVNLVVALNLVLLGSAGRTFDEVAKVLGLETGIDISRNSEVVHQVFGLLIDQMESNLAAPSAPRINFASGVFVQNGYPIRPVYKAVAENAYRSEVINLNFRGPTAQSVINSWVSDKTNGKITRILEQAPDPSTLAILVSALYFNGEWNQHFMPGATKRKPFFVEPNESVDIDMMYNGGPFKFYENKQLGAKIVRLPYKGDDTAMYVVLPTVPGAAALRNFVNGLNAETLEFLMNNMKNETCIIGLPRMKLMSGLHLRSTLQALGVHSLFDSATADLSLLSQGHSKDMQQREVDSVPRLRLTTPRPLSVTANLSPGKVNQLSSPTGDNDLFIFPRLGEDADGDGVKKNFFAYEDKIRGLQVQQWATGFSIAQKQRSRRQSGNRKPERNTGDVQRSQYTVNNEETGSERTNVVNLEQQKYRFESREPKQLRRSKRQTRPVNRNFLEYLRRQNLPSYGLDVLRNSANLVNPGLFATDILHKVEIDVTEKGTEAAASTAVILERDGNQKRLVASRPFLFFIMHEPTKLMLFWATVNTPTPNYRVT